MFSCEFGNIFKNTILIENLQATACWMSSKKSNQVLSQIIFIHVFFCRESCRGVFQINTKGVHLFSTYAKFSKKLTFLTPLIRTLTSGTNYRYVYHKCYSTLSGRARRGVSLTPDHIYFHIFFIWEIEVETFYIYVLANLALLKIHIIYIRTCLWEGHF